MTKESPLWLQSAKYAARLDRFFIEEVMRSQNRVFRGLVVTARAAGANFTVDVSPGSCAIKGTSQPFSGQYFMRSTAVENVAVPATPATNRTDTVIAVVNDPNAGGAVGGNWDIVCIAGTVVPDNAIALAQIARTPTESAINPAAITDVAPRGEWAWTVSTATPSGRGIPGDLWVQC